MDRTRFHPTTGGQRDLHRRSEGRILGGVAAGLAVYLDIDVAVVRVAMVALCLFAGMAAPLYLAGWLLIPQEGADSTFAHELLEELWEKARNCRPGNGSASGEASSRAWDVVDDARGHDAAEQGMAS